MDCEVCGKDSRELFLISVEGTKLKVCRGCSTCGTFIAKVQEPIERMFAIASEEPETELVDDYTKLIRGARQKDGLTQEDLAKKINENLNVLKKVEKGELTPPEKLSRKLEKLFKIRLFQQVKREAVKGKKSDASLSLEDVAVMKK